MDDLAMNHYEQQLYSVFKSFDVHNEESLDETAVNNLCDALQLEERSATLVDTLFERREGRVSFAQFRSGLLAVLGEPHAGPSAPTDTYDGPPSPTVPPDVSSAVTDPPDGPPAPTDPPPAGESKAGGAEREIEPRFVFGSKRYGRRSRPQHASAGDEPRAASASRLEGEERRPRYRRSASAAETREGEGELALHHDRRIDREEALALCRTLRMHSIDRCLVERIFDESATSETTVGDFFDQLNRSLGGATEEARAGEGEECVRGAEEPSAEEVVEAWVGAGVPRPRQLLAELGGAGSVERVLEQEVRALEGPRSARESVLVAALALSRRRAAAAATARAALAAERDKLRCDVAEANERARLLAQEMDESHARIENELKTSLKRAEAKHAEEARRAREEAAQERERAEAERARADAEAARRLDAETRLRTEAEAARHRADEAEARLALASERVTALERSGARSAVRAREAEARACAAAEVERAAEAMRARATELQRENQRLRDRADELCAALEAVRRPAPAPTSVAPAPTSAAPGPAPAPPPRDDLSAELRSVLLPECDEENASSTDPMVESPPADPERAARDRLPGGSAEDERDLEQSSRDEEKQRLTELVKELEGCVEALRGEYEACEEYWSGKLAAERAAHEADARASASRLADLVARIAAFERRLAPPAPALAPIPEAAALEAQVADLDAEFRRYRRDARARRAALHARLARAERAPAPAPPPAPALWARCGRAEGAVRRLQARLCAADALVKELYVENCQLAHAHAPPRAL